MKLGELGSFSGKIDLNGERPSMNNRRHILETNRVFAGNGFSAAGGVSPVCGSLQQQLQAEEFSCLDHFLMLAFAQLSGRRSLRDIETCLRAMQPRLYHMGFHGQVSRNKLAHASEHRVGLSMRT